MIYIVLPLVAEGKKVREIISKLRCDLSQTHYKLIAVVDGGDEITLEELGTLKGDDLIIRSNRVRMGMGATMSTGFLTAMLDSQRDDDYVITIEGDQVNSPNLLSELLHGLDRGADVVIASRYQAEDGYRNFPFARKFFSRSVNRLMRKICPIPGVSDYTIFLRGYRMKILNEAKRHFGKFGLIQAKGSISNTELLVKLSIFTRQFSEIPFTYHSSEKLRIRNVNIPGTINEYFVLILYLKRIFNKVRKYKALDDQGTLTASR